MDNPKNLNLKVTLENMNFDLPEEFESWCFHDRLSLEISDVRHSDVSIYKPACFSFISHVIFMAGTVSTLHKTSLPFLFLNRVHVSFETKEKVQSQDASPMRVLNFGSPLVLVSEPGNCRGCRLK